MNERNLLQSRFSVCIVLAIAAGGCIILILALRTKSHSRSLVDADIVAAVDPPVFDFGTVFQAQTISHQFSLSNQSDSELCVVAIKPSCSCTLVADELLGKVISPRGRLIFPVDYEVGDRVGTLATFVSIFVAATNAMEHLYEIRAHLKGNALPEFTTEPATIDFGSLKPGEQSSKTVAFLPKNAKNLMISDPVSNAPEFRVSMGHKTSDAPLTAVITFHAPTNASRQETLSEVVQFKTSSERVPQASVYVVGRIVPETEIIPNVIIMPSSGLSESGQTELTVRTAQPSRVKLLTRKTPNTSLSFPNSNNPATAEAWNKTHRFKIPNALLTQALGVDVELEVHSGADRIEARSIFVPIKSLIQ